MFSVCYSFGCICIQFQMTQFQWDRLWVWSCQAQHQTQACPTQIMNRLPMIMLLYCYLSDMLVSDAFCIVAPRCCIHWIYTLYGHLKENHTFMNVILYPYFNFRKIMCAVHIMFFHFEWRYLWLATWSRILKQQLVCWATRDNSCLFMDHMFTREHHMSLFCYMFEYGDIMNIWSYVCK